MRHVLVGVCKKFVVEHVSFEGVDGLLDHAHRALEARHRPELVDGALLHLVPHLEPGPLLVLAPGSNCVYSAQRGRSFLNICINVNILCLLSPNFMDLG